LTPLYVAGVGLFASGLPSWSAAVPVLTGARAWEAGDIELPSPLMLPKNERRRASPTIRIALEAARQAVEASGFAPRDLPAFFGSSVGDGDVLDVLVSTVTGGEERVSPTLFHNSVHNAPSGYWSIASGSQAPSLSIGAFDATAAATLLAAGVQASRQAVLVCVYDAVVPEPLRAVRPITMPFGAALVLSPEPTRSTVAQIAMRLGDRAMTPTGLRAPGLAKLLDGNPMAGLLPLLEALARRQTCEVVIPWEDAPPLTIALTPC
jgi:hypothetical protein